MLFWLAVAVAVAAMAVTAGLGRVLYRRAGASSIDALLAMRRPTSRMVSRGELVDGTRYVKVVLALTSTDLFYQNAHLLSSLDLRWVQDVEYGDSLADGLRPPAGGKVLRLLCFGRTFQFVVPEEAVPRWRVALPPRRRPEATPPVAAPIATAT